MSVIFNPASVGAGGGMTIGGAIVGGTSPDLLYVAPGGVLGQMTNLPTSYLNSGSGASSTTFWRGDGTWAAASLPSGAAWTLEGNPTGSSATPTAFTIGSLTAKTTPASTDQLLLQDNAASGALKSVPWSSLPSGGGGGGMSIGGAIVGGTAGEALMVGAGSVLAQTTNLPVSVLDSGIGAGAYSFWRGDGIWSNALTPAPYSPVAMGAFLRAWYEMDKLTGTAGSSQSTISDQSGNSYTLSQPTTGMQGTLALADQNGLNTLRFTAANSTQYQLALAILSGAVSGSMYMVCKTVSGTDGAMLDWGASGQNNLWPYSDGNYYIDFGNNARRAFAWTTGGNPSTSYRIISVYSAVNDWAFFVDGGTGGSAGGTSPLASSATNTVSWASAAPSLGASVPVAGFFFNGWIAEVYFTNSKQSTDDRQKNEGYLARKWGLLGNLDPTHPYKTVAPTYVNPTMKIGTVVSGGTPGSVLFIDSTGNLGQDYPHFHFDSVNNYLNLGVIGNTGIYYLNGLPSLYQVPNVSGANWFEGNAGGLNVTGYQNFGTGDGCLGLLTSGILNTAVGAYSCGNLTTGNYNTAFGSVTLNQATTQSYNFALGSNALHDLGLGGLGTAQNNVAIGYSALYQMRQGSGNVCINAAVSSVVTGSFDNNVVIGITAADNLGSGGAVAQFNIMLGANAGHNLQGASQNNTWIGSFQGASAVMLYSIAVSAGAALIWDWSVLNAQTTSIQSTSNPQDLHIYNTLDSATAPTNWERAVLGWRSTSNVFTIGTQAGGTGVIRLIAINGFQKAGAPAAADLPSGTMALINDTSGGQTWLCYNAAGTIRKVQLT
jgi:hypothetical protein